MTDAELAELEWLLKIVEESDVRAAQLGSTANPGPAHLACMEVDRKFRAAALAALPKLIAEVRRLSRLEVCGGCRFVARHGGEPCQACGCPDVTPWTVFEDA